MSATKQMCTQRKLCFPKSIIFFLSSRFYLAVKTVISTPSDTFSLIRIFVSVKLSAIFWFTVQSQVTTTVLPLPCPLGFLTSMQNLHVTAGRCWREWGIYIWSLALVMVTADSDYWDDSRNEPGMGWKSRLFEEGISRSWKTRILEESSIHLLK